MAAMLGHDDIVDGLRELAERARVAGIRGTSIRVVGGAALRLAYFERHATVDIDARIEPRDAIGQIALAMAAERNWPKDWLNDKASQFIPDWGRNIEWRLLHDDGSVSIWVAPVDALLAMKLHAVQGRPGRDTDDVAMLLRLNDIDDLDAAEALYESFYPGDSFNSRTVLLLEKMFQLGLPVAPLPPPVPDFGGQ